MIENREYLVTIIIPVYNAAAFLDICLDSVVNQSYRNLEVLLIDDGSTDASGRLCDKWSVKDSRVHVVHCENGGPSKARNIGLKKALGQFVMFVDSDDRLCPQAVKRSLTCMIDSRADLVAFGKEFIDEQGTVTRRSAIAELIECNPGDATYYDSMVALLKTDYLNPPWGKLIRRSLLTGLIFDESLIYEEDLDFNLKILAHMPHVVALNEVHYQYRHMFTGLANSFSVKKVDNVIEVNHRKIEFFEGRLSDAALCGLSSNIIDDYTWVINQIVRASNISVKWKIRYIRQMIRDETSRAYIKRGLLHASMTRICKIVILFDWTWLWRLYLRK